MQRSDLIMQLKNASARGRCDDVLAVVSAARKSFYS